MEFEDSRNAIFCDPNAYIQRYNKKEKQHKKVVFQEPYEKLPNFYLDNNFKRGDCVLNKHKNLNQDCKCNHENNCLKNRNCHNDNYHNDNSNKEKSFGFDFKNMLPLLSLFNKGGNVDLTSIMNMFNNSSGDNQNPMNIISTLLNSNSGIGNLFKGTTKNKRGGKELKTTDFEIKNYTKVE